MHYARFSIEPYVSLTTFREDGSPVPTRVWIAPYAGRLLVWTGAHSGKVQRGRHSPRATIAVCDEQGRLLNDPVSAQVRIMPEAEMPVLLEAMKAKYGWRFRVACWVARLGQLLRIRQGGHSGLELTLD